MLTAEDVVRYQGEILKAHGTFHDSKERAFEPLMTIQVVPGTTPQTIDKARRAGVVAGKVYPLGVTTNSENGVSDFDALDPVFEAMQEVGMVLSLHGESPDPTVFCLDREVEFLPIIVTIRSKFPRLKIVLEHVTTARAVGFIRLCPEGVAATITVHHLFLTLNDVIGGMLQPHHFCKPVAKRPQDRDALMEAALSGSPKFFLGTDSAPHLKEEKECDAGCAGIYTAPVALPLLTQFFETNGALGRLEDFVSRFGARFYGLPLNDGMVRLIRQPWTVPHDCGGIVPFQAGQSLAWQLG